ncbi:hypothetical protein QYF61_001583 [Mycteria americana]|uniref:Uncharacterized protein n=1 Tax=Mycteria americana TaxID=33587 RepID=A0AAN7S575_MYCAM|nr:hypothetical protein QYF61_001583 [Mycteria americana]
MPEFIAKRYLNTWDFNKLEVWAKRNLVQFVKEKCKVLHMKQKRYVHQHRLGNDWSDLDRT